MNLTEISKHIFPEDKMIAAVSNEVHEDYVSKILSGTREANSEKAKDIIKTLKRLARVNINARTKKEQIAGVVIL